MYKGYNLSDMFSIKIWWFEKISVILQKLPILLVEGKNTSQ